MNSKNDNNNNNNINRNTIKILVQKIKAYSKY